MALNHRQQRAVNITHCPFNTTPTQREWDVAWSDLWGEPIADRVHVVARG